MKVYNKDTTQLNVHEETLLQKPRGEMKAKILSADIRSAHLIRRKVVQGLPNAKRVRREDAILQLVLSKADIWCPHHQTWGNNEFPRLRDPTSAHHKS